MPNLQLYRPYFEGLIEFPIEIKLGECVFSNLRISSVMSYITFRYQ